MRQRDGEGGKRRDGRARDGSGREGTWSDRLQPAKVGGQYRRDADLARHGRQSADDGDVAAYGEGAAELDAEIGRRESGGSREQPGTGLGVGLTQRPPD